MSTHTSARDKPWIRSSRQLFEKMGWVFRHNPVGRRIRAEKIVDGKVVHSVASCCLNRVLIQIQAFEGRRR